MQKENKKPDDVETVGEYADKHLWPHLHALRAPRPVHTRVFDVTGIDDTGWNSLMGRLRVVD